MPLLLWLTVMLVMSPQSWIPLRVAVSLIVLSVPTVALVALVAAVAQLLMFTFTGLTKSFSSSVNVADERLFRYTEPSVPHELPLKRAA